MDADCVVIGAGVVGLAVARRLAATGRQVVVLEAEKAIGTQTSSRNSEVIHTGIYYPEGSLKARSCVAGRDMLYAYCEARKIPAQKIGKLIVATQEAQAPQLKALMQRGKANGVGDLIWMEREEAARIEPEVTCAAALFSPSTGIVDSAALMLSLQADAENSGALFAFCAHAARVERRGSTFAVETAEAPGEPLLCRGVVNCAGHGAQDFVRGIADYPADLIPPRLFAKGNYCSVSGRAPFSHLVYPLPVPGGLGVHVTLDLAGRMRLGPDLHWVDKLDYRPTEGIEEGFRASVASFWPGIADREIAPAYCGVRPKITGPGEASADFRIDGPSVHGVAGLVNCFGIESPGLTAALALAEVIERDLQA
jgi:L-2-hydroxyglutarate oxidase LhgO